MGLENYFIELLQMRIAAEHEYKRKYNDIRSYIVNLNEVLDNVSSLHTEKIMDMQNKLCSHIWLRTYTNYMSSLNLYEYVYYCPICMKYSFTNAEFGQAIDVGITIKKGDLKHLQTYFEHIMKQGKWNDGPLIENDELNNKVIEAVKKAVYIAKS